MSSCQKDALYGLRVTNNAGASELRETLAQMLTSQTAAVRGRREHFGRLASFWRHSAAGVCGKWLLDPQSTLAPDALLDAGVAAARDCPDTELAATVSAGTLALVLRARGGSETPLGRFDLGPTTGGDVFGPVQAMLETGAAGREEAFRGILAATRNAELRIYLVGKLRYLGIGDPDPLAYRLANRPDLDRELLRWLAAGNPSRASAECTRLVTEGNVESALLGTLALIAVDGADKERLLRFASTQKELPRAIITALVASVDEAGRLLNDPDPRIRGYAADYVLARPDVAAVLAAGKRASPHADVTIIRAELLLRHVTLMRSELATTPEFALAWRMKWMEHSEIASDGLWLAFQRALDAERHLALAQP
jgi:hypothetical protein